MQPPMKTLEQLQPPNIHQTLADVCAAKDRDAKRQQEQIKFMLSLLAVALPAVRLAAKGGNVTCITARRELVKLQLQRCNSHART